MPAAHKTRLGKQMSAARQDSKASKPGETHIPDGRFWTGTISFGLVSIPVNLLPASRPSKARLRLLGPGGVPLRRAYFSSQSGRELSNEEIGRGYEIADNQYVLITDEELESLAPEQSRDIDLRLFVQRDEILPPYCERAYFLLPADQTAKAYRLLAEVMEKTQRAGIATFVMRGKQYLIAIFADRGILRAETLRFSNELRTPADVGLPAASEAEPALEQRFARALRENAAPEISLDEMQDRTTEAILQVVERKREKNIDVVEVADTEAPTAAAGTDEEEASESVDILQVIRKSLAGLEQTSGAEAATAEKGARKSPAKAYDVDGLERESRADLLKRAQELNIPRRSSLTKEALIRALRSAA